METKELMIGDWMCYSKANKYYTRVNEIKHTEVPLDDQWYIEGVRSDNDKINPNALEYFAVEILSPIPLTDEILEQNGFELQRDKSEFGTLDTYWLGSELGAFRIHRLNNGGYQFGLAKIRNVHELQHALRLCKINKEIKL